MLKLCDANISTSQLYLMCDVLEGYLFLRIGRMDQLENAAFVFVDEFFAHFFAKKIIDVIAQCSMGFGFFPSWMSNCARPAWPSNV